VPDLRRNGRHRRRTPGPPADDAELRASDTRESALAAREGRLVLSACRTCGFAWNRSFDPERLVYDDNYDNSVPSDVMRR
jgi:hypothetical protein